jgi:CubicO group peptidase (beta-lactamase class C family)
VTPDILTEQLATHLAPRLGAITPAHAWGVFDHGRLLQVHGGNLAETEAAHTAFRIASCTKSFTAAAALLLAEDGVLDLDEPLADALDVPLRILGPGGPAPTVLDALTMRAGFPTDDPWGDRQEPLTDAAFAELLGDGVRTVWPAGARFEYSNLGYAIVGRIIGLRAGMPYRRVVESRLLGPLGLHGTGFDASVGNTITGYRPGPDGWEPLPFSAPGAFSPIGGLFSTVTDLSRWCGVLSGATDAGEVLPAHLAERMRHPHTAIAGDAAGDGAWSAYGLGLMVRADGAGRLFVGHSGGYPGFTTRMEWEQGSQLGAVVFENATYTGLTGLTLAAFSAAFGGPDAVLAPAEPTPPAFTPWPETVAAAERARAAIVSGALPDAELLDACVALDVPLGRRAATIAELVAGIGGVHAIGELAHETPARARWELRGPRGALRCGILMTPTAHPRIQKLDVAAAG